MVASSLVDEISDGAGFVSLLLALVTVFTAEVEREREHHRQLGNPSNAGFKRIGSMAAGLAVLTAASVLALLDWFLDAAEATIERDPYEPALAIFSISWVLLLVLVLWQVWIAQAAFRRR